MKNFAIGLALGLLGTILWVIASVIAGVISATEGEDDLFADPVIGGLVVIGFAVMLGGPLLYWFVLPIVGLVRSRGR